MINDLAVSFNLLASALSDYETSLRLSSFVVTMHWIAIYLLASTQFNYTV